MSETIFNPEATDGDNDGIIQEGTPFERLAEEVLVDPTEESEVSEETIEPEVISEAVEDLVEETVSVAEEEVKEEVKDLPKKKSAPKKTKVAEEAPVVEEKTTVVDPSQKVALYSSKNLYWEGVGRLRRGFNIVTAAQADSWLSRDDIRVATPAEVAGGSLL